MKIALTGSRGFIGSALLAHLQNEGHQVFCLQRPDDWNIDEQTMAREKLEGIDAMVHLAGINLAERRWTEDFKQKIIDSRIKGTALIAQGLASLEKKPKVLVMASAVGFYGAGHDNVFSEDDGVGEGFLANLCHDWEAAAKPAAEAGIRVVKARLGVVLGPGGGALEKMLLPFKLGLGGPLGSGAQAFPWISRTDAVSAFLWLIENGAIEGPVNVVAPQMVTQGQFAKALGKVLHRPAFMPLPAFVARLMFGEMADELLLSGQAVKAEVLKKSGFAWKQPQLDLALGNIFEGNPRGKQTRC